MGQRPLSVAQVVDRLRSGSAASAAEACVTLGAVMGQCQFVKKRLGRDLRCAPFATVAVGAALIPSLVGLLAKGGYTATWACWSLFCTCTSGRSFGLDLLTCSKGDIAGARAAFLAEGGVEAAVKLLELSLRHPRLAKMSSILSAAVAVLELFVELSEDFKNDRDFKIRCIDAGIVPPLLYYLEHEDSFSEVIDPDSNFPSIARIIAHICWRDHGKVVPAVVTSFLGAGIAPLLVGRLRLPAG